MEAEKIKKIEFTVLGMTWMGWEPKVRKALEGLQGVEKVVVSYPEKKATVMYDDESTDFNQMKKALLGDGYVAIAESNPNIHNDLATKPTGKTEFQAGDLVCYCFKHTKKDIEQDYIKNSRSTIMAKIAAEKKAGECDCTTKNPKGRWCLADVRQVVDNLKGKSSFNVFSWKTGDQGGILNAE